MSDERSQRRESIPLERRLLYLSGLRVLMVTLLLGSAIVVNINDVKSFADPSYVVMASMIVATYVASIVYALVIKTGRFLVTVGYVQLVGDVLLAAGLIMLTGGAQSVFSFLLYLSIINGAAVLGRTGAFTIATLSSLVVVGLLVMRLGGFEQLLSSSNVQALTSPTPIYATVVNIFGFYGVSALSGWLAKRLDEQGVELRRRELDIEELRKLYHDILASISSGVVTLDSDGVVLLVNESAQEILSCVPEDVFGLDVREAIPELGPAVEVLLASNDNAGGSDRWQGWLTRGFDSTEIFLGVTVSPLRRTNGEVYGHILAMKDLTHIQQMERRVQQKERLAAVGQLAAAIAHEIRNPLASISGSVEMMEDMVDDGDESRTLMRIVLREIDRLNQLIGDFLEYAGPNAEIREDFDIHELLEDITSLFVHDKNLLGEIQVEVDLDKIEGCIIEGDPGAWRQVIWNLLRNAAEALEHKGHISIVASLVSGVERKLGWSVDEVAREEVPNLVCVRIRDDGPGMSEEVSERVFEPFFTTKSKGTGLGLATVGRIVSEHRAYISLESKPGQGTTFVLLIPLSVADPQVDAGDVRDTLSEASSPWLQ